MRYALSWSGGKDSTLALDRAVRQGLQVRCLLNIYEGSTGRVRFHGIRRDLIIAQARALELELLQRPTGPEDFEAVFLDALETLDRQGYGGIVFGNIHLADIRDWYEARTRGIGFEHVEPLWGEEPASLIREFHDRGYRARIVSVDLERGDADWAGREFDEDLIQELGRRPDIDPCGEHGEFHSFVYDGPLFRRPVRFRTGRTLELEGHRFIDLRVPRGSNP